MTQSRALFVSAAVIALLFGLEFPDPKLVGEPSPLPNDNTMVLAANEGQNSQPQAQTEENADESQRWGRSPARRQATKLLPLRATLRRPINRLERIQVMPIKPAAIEVAMPFSTAFVVLHLMGGR